MKTYTRLTLDKSGTEYWIQVLLAEGHTMNPAQVRYLICLVLQHIYTEKNEGRLLSDTEMEDLAPEYIRSLMLAYANQVYKVTALAYPGP